MQRVARRWRELNCSPEDELCLCARTGSGICAHKCECLLIVHLCVLLSAIQRKIMVTGGQEVHVGCPARRVRVSSARDGAKTSIEFLIVFQKVLVHTK